jgi:hypothetical protein
MSLFIGVGCSPGQRLPFEVLRYSITAAASEKVEIQPLFENGIEVPMPTSPRNRPRTPFSFQRFTIPQARGYKDRALYVDSDMLVFADVAALWRIDFGDANVLCTPGRKSVLLLDCERLDWDIRELASMLDDGRLRYGDLMGVAAVSRLRPALPRAWNEHDRWDERTSLLHYTRMETQPWLVAGHPYEHLWTRTLFRAMDDGAISPQLVEESVAGGYVRPSLRFQVEHRIESSSAVPTTILEADQPFTEFCRKMKFSLTRGAGPPTEGAPNDAPPADTKIERVNGNPIGPPRSGHREREDMRRLTFARRRDGGQGDCTINLYPKRTSCK